MELIYICFVIHKRNLVKPSRFPLTREQERGLLLHFRLKIVARYTKFKDLLLNRKWLKNQFYIR